MLVNIVNELVKYLYKEEIICNEDKEIYQYGFEVLFSGIISIFLIILFGFFLNQTINSVIFLITFIITREYCGGYHAESYLKCNILFVIVFFASLGVSYILIIYPHYLTLIYIFYFICIFKFSPIDNDNKKLCKKEKEIYHKKSIVIALGWGVIMFLGVKFNFTNIIGMLPATLFMISMLILIEKSRKRKVCDKEMRKTILKKVSKLGLISAQKATGKASWFGMHEPKEPKKIKNFHKQ